jgi:hypothetical protein
VSRADRLIHHVVIFESLLAEHHIFNQKEEGLVLLLFVSLNRINKLAELG